MKDRVADVAPRIAPNALSAEQRSVELVRQRIIETARGEPDDPLPPPRNPSMNLDDLLIDLDVDRSDR